MWCLIEYKAPTWDQMAKIIVGGPSLCTLCRAQEEMTLYLFISCSFTVHIWKACSQKLAINFEWTGTNVEATWKS